MRSVGLVILGIIAFAVIIVLVVVEILEFTIGLILFAVAALVLWALWKWLKNKIDD